MKKLAIIVSLMASTLIPHHVQAQPNLTWDDFDCANYSSKGFTHAGLKPGLKVMQAAQMAGGTLVGYGCDYGYRGSDGLTLTFFKPDEPINFKQANEDQKSYLNDLLDSVTQGKLHVDHERVVNTKVHDHPAQIYDYKSNGWTMGKVICVALKTSSDGVVCIINLGDQTLSDKQLTDLARATIV